MKIKLVAGLMGLALVVVLGCASTAGVWVDINIDKANTLHVEDPAFAANIKVNDCFHEKTPEGFLYAQVEVQNTNRTDYKCQYRFEWIREGGMTQEHSEMSWHPITLHGREPFRLKGMCTVKDAERFRIIIRRAD